ncbi:npc intracellular cholesterol transporter 1 [Anaeramoeba ignava]|uniref:Npc intracellular cholesterol transporter 1 n=1 Tax=Anaeramoeba ignava TaxID=1746090 RepID=A0A9Q0LN79_ANAIG|nr:npc intracellular cholesterol transporter 1 [Anaeramoeba ignava]|eukprot:Anaeramoba_ignava/a478983_138.p1 GENE.a478983_138~~a478983_138.p1  ORF type:complete len:269 (-),score=49.35 a478983_138:36-842(-)
MEKIIIILIIICLTRGEKTIKKGVQAEPTPMCVWEGAPPNGPVIYKRPPQQADPPVQDCIPIQNGTLGGCCNYTQMLYFTEKFKTAISFFGGCPACVNNIHTTWCHYDCDPYQASFVSTTNHEDGQPLLYPKLTMCRRWAKAVYESCQWVHFVSSMWPTYEAFWITQGGDTLPIAVEVLYPENDDDPFALCPLDELEKCEDSCDCLTCPIACQSGQMPPYENDEKKVGAISQFNFWMIIGCSLIGIMFLFVIFKRSQEFFKEKKLQTF